MIKLYSTHCPKCKIIEKKLSDAGIDYEEINDTELMLSLGIKDVPVLEIDGDLMDFKTANQWINKYKEEL